MTISGNEEYIKAFRERLPTKIHALMLGTGYVESASWSKMLFVHPKGFKSLFGAIKSIRKCIIQVMKYNCKYSKTKMPKGEELNEEIKEFFHDIHHGMMDGTGDFWQALTDEGWDFPHIITKDLCEYTWLSIDCAPELVSIEREIPLPEDELDFWEQCYFHVHTERS